VVERSRDYGYKERVMEFSLNNSPQYIIFQVDDVDEFIKLCPNGDIYVKGKLIENDKELVDGLREWLTKVGG
jgi:hypothetical protein